MDPGRLAASNRLLPVFEYAYAWQEGVAPPSSRALTHLLAARYANVLRRRWEQEPGKVLAKVVQKEEEKMAKPGCRERRLKIDRRFKPDETFSCVGSRLTALLPACLPAAATMQPQLQAPTLSLSKGQSPAEALALPEASAGNGLSPPPPNHERAPLLFGGGGVIWDAGMHFRASQSGPVRQQRIIRHSGPFPPFSQHNNQNRQRDRGKRDVRADI